MPSWKMPLRGSSPAPRGAVSICSTFFIKPASVFAVRCEHVYLCSLNFFFMSKFSAGRSRHSDSDFDETESSCSDNDAVPSEEKPADDSVETRASLLKSKTLVLSSRGVNSR